MATLAEQTESTISPNGTAHVQAPADDAPPSWPPPLFVAPNSPENERYYLKHRWQSQWLYYDKNATFNKRYYQLLQLVIGVGSVAVPVLISFEPAGPLVATIISLVVAAAAAIENVKKYGDNWRTYRKAAEDLQREKALYDSKAGSYGRSKYPYLRFVERCEEIIAEQNGQFIQQHTPEEKEIEDKSVEG